MFRLNPLTQKLDLVLSRLNELTDVQAPTPVDNQRLAWSDDLQRWIPKYSESALGFAEFAYRISSNIDGTPNPGRIEGNNADGALMTVIYVNEENNDGIDITLFLENIHTGDWLNIHDPDDVANTYIRFDVIGEPTLVGDVWNFPVSFFDRNGSIFTNNQRVRMYVRYNNQATDTGGFLLWRDKWVVDTYYQTYNVVQDDGWAMVANKNTTAKPAPVTTSDIMFSTDTFNTTITGDVAYTGINEYVFAETRILNTLKIYAPEVGPQSNFTVYLQIFDTTPEDGTTKVYTGLNLVSGEIKYATIPTLIIPEGKTLRIGLNSQYTDDTTTWSRDYQWAGYTSTNVQPKQCNLNAGQTLFRISYTDWDDVYDTVPLDEVVPGTIFTVTQKSNTNKWFKFQVTEVRDGDLIRQSFVGSILASNNTVNDNATVTVVAEIPISTGSTLAYEANWWTTNAPLWATSTKGYLLEDGVEQAGNENNAFPIDIGTQSIAISEDWDVLAFPPTTVGIGGGSGSGDGITEIVQDTTPQLGGDLDLNSNDITGTGNIDITGVSPVLAQINTSPTAWDNTFIKAYNSDSAFTDKAGIRIGQEAFSGSAGRFNLDVVDNTGAYVKHLLTANLDSSTMLSYANIYPSTDSTYNLGSSSVYWQYTYTDRLYLNSTAYFDGGTAGQTTLTGKLYATNINQDLATTDSPTFAGLNTNGNSLTDVLAEDGVFVIGHRGTPSTAPEHTMEGYRVAVASSVKAIEPDVYMISDNSLVVMHDSTVDRTTTSSGTVASYTASSWRQLVVDASSFLGGGWSDQNAPFLSEVLSEFGNKAIIVPEAKNTCMAELCDMLDRFGVGNDMVLLQSFGIDECDVAVARGYKVIWLGNVSVDTADTHGIPFVGPSYTWAGLDTTYVNNAHSKNIGVIAYTVNRLYELDALDAKGVDGVFSDDPVYLNNRGPKLTEDAWDKQTWLPGTIAPSGRRGTFYAPDWYGFDYVFGEQNACQQGWVSTKDGNTFTIDFTARIDQVSAAGRWFGIYVGTDDIGWYDYPGGGGDGYHALFRNTGEGTIYRVANGTATNLGAFTSTAVTLGVTEVQLRLTVTPTNVKWERVDVAASKTVEDSTYRGLSCVSLSSNGVGVRYKSLAVT